MSSHVLVWDIETVPDLKGFAAANDLNGSTDEEIRAAIGDRFPKHVYHSIICIGALAARRDNDQWVVEALGAPHVGEHSEKELIRAFVNRIAELNPQLVTFNGTSFDLPVMRYRAMVHSVSAPGLAARPYFNRYNEDAIDLCDALSSFSSQAKATLHELSRVMGLPGKPQGIRGAEVEKYFLDGHIREIAAYCESDVINTYRLWLRYELFRGNLSEEAFQASESNLAEFLQARGEAMPVASSSEAAVEDIPSADETSDMSRSHIEVNYGPWEKVRDKFNELSREYNFNNLGGPGTATRVELRCRLTVEDVPLARSWFQDSAPKRRVTPFIYLVIQPHLREQTQFVAAIFGPSDDLISYKVLTAKLETVDARVSFVVFDESDGEHLLEVLMLGRPMTLQLVTQQGESIGRIPLHNDLTFQTEYKSFKAALLTGV